MLARHQNEITRRSFQEEEEHLQINSDGFYEESAQSAVVEELSAAPSSPSAVVLLKQFISKAKKVPFRSKIIITGLVLLVLAGNAMNIIGLNFWLTAFPADPTASSATGGNARENKKTVSSKTPAAVGAYTTLIVSSLLFTLFFAGTLLGYLLYYKPQMRWAFRKEALWTLFIIGFWDGTNSWLTIFATTSTPEILQAIFLSIAPMFSLIFTKLILKDRRNYFNRWVMGSFGLMILSMMVASYTDFMSKIRFGESKKIWSLLFLISVPQLALCNVYQAKYMRDHTFVGEDNEDGTGRKEGEKGAEEVNERSKLLSSGEEGSAPPLYHSICYGAILSSSSPDHPERPEQSLALVRQASEKSIEGEGTEKRRRSSQPTTPGSSSSRGTNAYRPFHIQIGKMGSNLASSGEFASSYTKQRRSSSSSPGSPYGRERINSSDGYPSSPTTPQQKRRGSFIREEDEEERRRKEEQIFGMTCSDDTTVKVFMLFGDTFIQLLLCLLLLPTDAIPWFGESSSVADAWENLWNGFHCLFNCKLNFLFCLVYSGGYVFTYIGCAYLNQYSATLSMLISQLGSPMTAVLLLLVPTLNVSQDISPWYTTVAAVVLMIAATVVYTIWEEMTTTSSDDEEEEEET